MAMPVSPEVRAFLERPGMRFAQTFVTADPTGARATDRAQLADALPKRRAMFEAAGVSGLRLDQADETPLDGDYILVRTTWIASRRSGPDLQLSSSFVLRRMTGDFEIVFYLNSQDLRSVLKSGG
jgi:hypothetical protein